MDFDRAASKLKKEQEKRRQEAQRKLERERKAQEEARRQQALIAEAIQERKREQAAREEAERLAAEEERLLTAGIAYSEELLALEAAGEGDKLTLPPSALDSLTKQDALAQGPMLFRVTRSDSGGSGSRVRTTHAGVLEFSAAEGTVGLPLKVQRSLGLRGGEGQADDAPLGSVVVKYVRLEKGTYAKIQPRTSGLSQVPELKAMLEMNLHNHATLSTGDLLQVWYRGKPFDLRVTDLQPEPQVTVIDTDIEVDVDVPEDQQQQQQAAATTPRPSSSSTGTAAGASSATGTTPPRASGGTSLGGGGGGKTLGGSASSASASASPPPPPAPSAGGEAQGEEDREQRRRERQAAALAALPAEPSADAEGAIALQIRMPDGKPATRRFLLSSPFAHVFAFVDAVLPTAAAAADGATATTSGSSYRLVTRFPRRVFTAEGTAGQTLAQAGVSGRQEALMFESC